MVLSNPKCCWIRLPICRTGGPADLPLWCPALISKGDVESRSMQTQFLSFLFFVVLSLSSVQAQNTIPTFRHTVGQNSYVLVGRDPAQGGTTTIPTILVPVILSFEAKKVAGMPFVMDATPDIRRLLRSPVFS